MYRLERDFYTRVKERMQGVWGKIFVVQIISSLITGVVSSRTTFADAISYLSNPSLHAEYELQATTFSFSSLAVAIVSAIITISLQIEVYKYLKTHEFDIGGIFKNISENSTNVLMAGVIKGALSTFLPLIPLGGLIWIVVDFGFMYVAYLIVELPEKDPISYFKDSWELTKGKKMDLFKILIHYLLLMFVGIIVMIIGVIIIAVGSAISDAVVALGGIIVIAGLILMTVIAIIKGPYIVLANTLYFEEHMEYEQINLSYE